MFGEQEKKSMLLPVLLSALAIPVSMVFWIANVIYSFFSIDSENYHEGYPVISPWRWLVSVIIPITFSLWGLKKKSLDISGAILGLFVGFILTLTSFAHLACLLVFFLTSSKATKFRSHKKRKLDAEFKEGGQRNWIQVLCNGGMAAQLALLYLMDVGCGERPIDFYKNYRSSWLSIGILAALACCNGDTWASEFGTVIGNSKPYLITTWKKVPKGTNGGVSLVGLLMSLIGGLLIGLAHYITVIYLVDTALLQLSPPQWPIILVGACGGFFGSIVDSLLGATLQYSGINKNGVIIEHPGKGIKHISGRKFLDNHSVNLLSSIFMALILPRIANLWWL